MLDSSKAAFLGDPDFPKSSLKYLKGGRIRLFQILYERYSNLEFTVIADRAIAITGLEKRLLKTFGTKGGFGVLDLYLHRSLLWKKSGKNAMARLHHPSNLQVPSWSWMALDGPICYLDIPLGQAQWTRSLGSPFSAEHSDNSENGWEIDKGHPRLALKAIAHKFSSNRSNTLRRLIIFDTDVRTDFQDLRCIVVKRQKLAFADEKQKYYVLVVRRSPLDGDDTVERVGVGVIEKMHLSFDQEGYDVWII